MIKRVLQKSLVMLLAIGFLVMLCLFDGMTWEQLADNLTFLIMAGWAYVILDDFFAKCCWYRYAITKYYLLNEVLYVAALAFFCASFLTASYTWGIVAMCLCVVFQAGAMGYQYWLYKKTDYMSFEIERMKWYIMLNELKGLTRGEVEEKVNSFLRYYPKRDYLEGPLALSKPIDKAHLRTVAEMKASDDADTEEVQNAIGRVGKLIDDFCNLYGIE